MKFKLILFAFLSVFCVKSQTPRAGGINNSQATVLNAVHDNFTGVQSTNNNAFAVYDFATNFNYILGLKTTDNIAEGSINKYFSTTLARNAFSAGFGLVYSSGIYSLDSSTQGILASVAGKFNNPTGTISQYLDGTGALRTFPTIPASLSAGSGINISSNTIINTAPDQIVTLTAGNRILITGTYPNFTISFVEPSINIITSKSFNTNFTVSSTKQATVSYSVTCTVTNPLLAGSSTANVYLEYSTNGGSTWLLPSQNGNSSTVGVAVAIAITNGQTGTVTGVIPANALVRLRTATTGTANVTFVTGTEIY